MSIVAIRAALEGALLELGWADATAFENVPFDPPPDGVPYQRVTCSFIRPWHVENSRSYRQEGWMQVDLAYPAGASIAFPSAGPGEASERAHAIRTAFFRGRTMQHSGIKVMVDEAPEIMTGYPGHGRYTIPVVVRFSAQIQVPPV